MAELKSEADRLKRVGSGGYSIKAQLLKIYRTYANFLRYLHNKGIHLKHVIPFVFMCSDHKQMF